MVWSLFLGLANNPDVVNRRWFRTLLESLGAAGIMLPPHAPGMLKRIPMELLTDTVEVRRHLLAGFVDGDGSLHSVNIYVVGVAAAAGGRRPDASESAAARRREGG